MLDELVLYAVCLFGGGIIFYLISDSLNANAPLAGALGAGVGLAVANRWIDAKNDSARQ